ncbi:MAG: rhodanese-like domain-containing protein [Tannerella sp.]|jgi:rhodanese-related sulfurtransferase|nr:rhodanese-like domain-containing protein [Tannerella sp.]
MMMKKLVYLATFALLFSCRGQFPRQNRLRELVRHESTLIVDVRTPEEFGEGHIGNSVNIPLDVISEHVERLKPYASLIVVCRSGRRSAQAKTVLEEKDFTNVYDGGGWKEFESKIGK